MQGTMRLDAQHLAFAMRRTIFSASWCSGWPYDYTPPATRKQDNLPCQLEHNMNGHPTENIVLKSASVDKDIVPVIQFLNRFDGIRTIWSCQGDDLANPDPDGTNAGLLALPYVSFSADDMDSLRIILQALARAPCEVVIDYNNDLMPFRFTLRFISVDHLQNFGRWLIEQQ